MNDYYVSTLGDDRNNGETLDTPLLSVQKALDKALAGDVIRLLEGHYYFNNPLHVKCMGEENTPIIMKPYNNQTVVFDFSRINDLGPKEFVIDITQGTRYFIMEDIDIQNSRSSGIRAINAFHIIIRNCKIHHIAHFGISIRADGCLVENNELYNIATAWAYTKASGGWPQIMNTYFKPPLGDAVVGSYAYNNVFRGNYIHDCWGEGIDPIFGDGILIEDNVIRDVFSVGIYLDSSRNVMIRNNKIYSTCDTYNRYDFQVPMTGIGMGTEYFGNWSDNAPISHNENIIIYHNELERVGTGFMWWHDENNTDHNNTFKQLRIFNNLVDTINGSGKSINFSKRVKVLPTQNEVRKNVFLASDTMSYCGEFEFSHNKWVSSTKEFAQNKHIVNTPIPSIQPVIPQPIPDSNVGINIIKNGSFDKNQKPNSNPLYWNAIEDTDAAHIVDEGYKGGIDTYYEGQYSLKLGAKKDYHVYVHQKFKNIKEGRYGLRARVKRFGNGGTFYMEANVVDSDEKYRCRIPMQSELNSTWADYNTHWLQLNMSDILYRTGEVIIGFYGDGSKEDWVLIDEVWFYQY